MFCLPFQYIYGDPGFKTVQHGVLHKTDLSNRHVLRKERTMPRKCGNHPKIYTFVKSGGGVIFHPGRYNRQINNI